MKKIIFALLILWYLLWSFHSAYADTSYQKNVPDYVNYIWDQTFNVSTKIGDSLDIEWGTLKVNGNLEIWEYADIEWNLIVIGDLILWSYGDITGNVIVTGSAILWEYTDIEGSLEVWWDSIAGYGLDINGASKIWGNLTLWESADINNTLYVYKNLNTADYAYLGEDDSKIKVVGNLVVWDYADMNGKLYLEWTKSVGAYYDETNTKYSGLFGRIDPLLQYDFSEVKIQSIRNKTQSYLQQADAETNQTKKKEIYTAMFSYLQTFIETESFDQGIFADIQREYTGVALEKNTSTQNAVIYTPMLPTSLESRLDSLMKNIPEADKIDTLSQISINIDTAIVRLKSTQSSASVIRKINILMWIQEYIEQEISEVQSDSDILRELGF